MSSRLVEAWGIVLHTFLFMFLLLPLSVTMAITMAMFLFLFYSQSAATTLVSNTVGHRRSGSKEGIGRAGGRYRIVPPQRTMRGFLCQGKEAAAAAAASMVDGTADIVGVHGAATSDASGLTVMEWRRRR